jgi:histidyl-tRNA synthetase
MGVRLALVIGPDEDVLGQVTIKDLKLGTQQTISRLDAVGVILSKLQENT